MTQIIQKLANSKARLGLKASEPARYFAKRLAAPLLRVARLAVVPLAFSAAWARRSERASAAFMQKPTVKFHTANSQSLAAG